MNPGVVLPWFGLTLGGIGGMMLNVMPDAVTRLIGLVLLYLGGSVLLLNVCSFQMCAALFVCGIGVIVLLWSSQRENSSAEHSIKPAREWILFRIFLSLIFGVLAYTATELVRFWLPVRSTILFISLWISLLSLSSLALDDMMLYRCICLQSLCLSFTVCYIYMENSVLVFAFFAAINLLMAFGGSVLSMGGSVPSVSEETA